MKIFDWLFPPRDSLCPPAIEAFRRRKAADGTYCAPLRYEGAARDAVLRFKFNGRTWYAGYFAQLMAGCAREAWPDADFDAVVWVPCHFWRRWKRGYDQAELLAREVAARLNLPLVNALHKIKNTRTQNRLHSVEERRRNVAGAFAVRKTASVAGKRLLLADDVDTTGSTLDECRRLLLQAGACEVRCVTLADAHAKEWGKDKFAPKNFS